MTNLVYCKSLKHTYKETHFLHYSGLRVHQMSHLLNRFPSGIYGIDKLSAYLLYGGLGVVVLFNLLN